MERKKLMVIASVSASVLLASSLLVACTATEATGPGESETAGSVSQTESTSVSVSRADSNAPASSRSASQSSRPAGSSGTPASSAPPSSQAPAAQSPQSAAPQATPQTQAPEPSPECPPEPAPTQPPTPEPPPAPPAPSVNIDACLSAGAGWASGNNMAVNDALYIGGAGYENPIETNGKTDAQVSEHLLHQLGLIHSQLVSMPEFDPATTYPCYKFEVVGTMIYVLYG